MVVGDIHSTPYIRQGTKHQKGRHIRQGTYPSLQPQQTVYPQRSNSRISVMTSALAIGAKIVFPCASEK